MQERVVRLSLVAIATFALGCAAFTTAHPRLLHADDSYFYFEVALHLARGEGSRFHSFAPTNGYPPLWEGICAGLAVLGADRGSLPYVAVVLANAMSVAAILLLAGALRANGVRNAAIGLGAFAAFAFFTTMGLEGQLSAFLLAAARRVAAEEGTSARRSAAVHVLLALTVLARLDTLFVCGALALAELTAPSPRPSVPRLALATLPYGLLVGGYVAANMILFGHPMPISDRIESTIGGGGLPDLALGIGVLTLVAALVVAGLGRPGFLRWTSLAIGVGVGLHAASLATVLPGDGQLWYFFA